jgi:hypothetical protein
MATTAKGPPWKRKSRRESSKLTTAHIAEAKAAAAKAGRRYPKN